MAQGRSTEIITVIKWIRTSRLSIKELSLSLYFFMSDVPLDARCHECRCFKFIETSIFSGGQGFFRCNECRCFKLRGNLIGTAPFCQGDRVVTAARNVDDSIDRISDCNLHFGRGTGLFPLPRMSMFRPEKEDLLEEAYGEVPSLSIFVSCFSMYFLRSPYIRLLSQHMCVHPVVDRSIPVSLYL